MQLESLANCTTKEVNNGYSFADLIWWQRCSMGLVETKRRGGREDLWNLKMELGNDSKDIITELTRKLENTGWM